MEPFEEFNYLKMYENYDKMNSIKLAYE
jgi:hypothetical protein